MSESPIAVVLSAGAMITCLRRRTEQRSLHERSGMPRFSNNQVAWSRFAFRSPYSSREMAPLSSRISAPRRASDHPLRSSSIQMRTMAAEGLFPSFVRRRAMSIIASSMLSVDSAVKRQVLAADSGEVPSVSMSASTPGEEASLGERLRFAIKEEDRTETSVNTALMPTFSKGDISSLCTGRRGTNTIDPKKMSILADYLHVRLEWLLVGKGPMRRDGRTEKTPAEVARSVALTFNIREDAWKTVWERNRDRAAELTATDWFDLIRAEAEHLDRMGVPQPARIGQAVLDRDKKRRSARDKGARDDGSVRMVADGKHVSGGRK